MTYTTDAGGLPVVPQHMDAAVLMEIGRVDIVRRTVPVPAPGDVLIEVSAVGVCGSDTHYFRSGRIGDHVVTEPLVLGHEAAGRIVGVGDGVAGDRVGQRVSIEPQRPDPDSVETRRGRYNLCSHMRFYGTPPVDGALTQYVTIGAGFAHPVPDSMSDEAAALIEPLSVGIAALRKAEIGPGASVLVAGAGPIGLVCAQVARAFGATRIVVSDIDADRRTAATRFGATEVVGPQEIADLPAFDAFVDASGASAAIVGGVRALRPAGRAVLVGMGSDDVSLPVSVVRDRELVLTGVFRYADTWPTAIDLVAAGRVDLDSMVTGRYPLEESAAALEADRIPGSIKAVVRPGTHRIEEEA